MFDWTSLTVLPTATGKFNLRWYIADDRPQSKVFENMSDLLDFIEMNF
jgi:hypothetical protein